MHLGLIGFGRLGQLLARYLVQDFHITVYDPHLDRDKATELGLTVGSLAEACAHPIVVPLVPISAFDRVIQDIAPLLQPEALVVDACSVKVKPVQSMLKHLPESVSILATHPMFGPDSARETLFGSKLVLCPVRMDDARYREIYLYLEKHGIKLIESTAEEHDRQISRSLFLAHFLGRSLLELEASPLEIDTKGYRRMMKILLTVENDSWQLFEDMYNYNPFAEETRHDFLAAVDRVVERLKPS